MNIQKNVNLQNHSKENEKNKDYDLQPIPPFFRFRNDVYSFLEKKGISLSINRKVQIVADKWNQLGVEDKAEYLKEYNQEMIQYTKKKQELDQKISLQKQPKQKRIKKVKKISFIKIIEEKNVGVTYEEEISMNDHSNYESQHPNQFYIQNNNDDMLLNKQ